VSGTATASLKAVENQVPKPKEIPMRRISNVINVALALLACTAVAQAAPELGVSWVGSAIGKGGVKITKVKDNSAAAELGLEAGDVIVAINGKLVNTGKEATDAVAGSKGQVSIILQDGDGGFVQIDAQLDEETQGLVAGAGKTTVKKVKKMKVQQGSLPKK
jgi:membrane-associated protease RseP (regulator of RpoE activity)